MTTLPPPSMKPFPDDSIEKQVYNIVDGFKEYIPVDNDRYRLGYGLFKYLTGEGDAPEVLVQSSKVKIVGISARDLAAKLDEKLKEIKK